MAERITRTSAIVRRVLDDAALARLVPRGGIPPARIPRDSGVESGMLAPVWALHDPPTLLKFRIDERHATDASLGSRPARPADAEAPPGSP